MKKIARMNKVPDEVFSVCFALTELGHEAVLVGGCVRDVFLGRDPHDWDVATNAMPDQVQKAFDHTIPTGIKHGTVTVVVGGQHIEVTTYRADGAYSDGRHPDEVKLGVTLEEDLSRRDFTMNAIAVDPVRGHIVDPWDGKKDIEDRIIRAVGHAEERFREDGLRMMRAVRFAATLGFELEQGTRMALRNSLGFLDGVSAERLRDELVKLLGAEKPSVGLRLAALTGLLWKVIPELAAQVEHPQNSHHKLDVWWHTLMTVDNAMPDPIHRMGALLHDVGKPACAEPAYGPGQFSFHGHAEKGAETAKDIMERLKFSNKDIERVVTMVRRHMALFGYSTETKKKHLLRIIKKVGVERLPDILCLTFADTIAKGDGEDPEVRFEGLRERLWEAMKEHAEVEKSQLAINGRDLMTHLNIKPGPQIGQILQALLELVLEHPEFNTRDILLGRASAMRCHT